MTLSKLFILGSSLTLLNGCIVIAKPSHANIHLERELSLSAEQLKQLDIETGAGELRIVGSELVQEVKVTADVFTSFKDRDDYEFTLEKKGNKAYLVAKHRSTSGFWVGSSPRIDVIVTLPADLLLDIHDSSGDIWVKDMDAAIDLHDGSGDVELRNITGNLALDDGSGELIIEQITGNINVLDGSGEISISDIKGNVELEDGSGELTIKHVDGYVSIDDSSGDMLIRDISGKVTIEDGSGDIDVEGAGGLNIIDDGSGDLHVSKVKGDFSIDS